MFKCTSKIILLSYQWAIFTFEFWLVPQFNIICWLETGNYAFKSNKLHAFLIPNPSHKMKLEDLNYSLVEVPNNRVLNVDCLLSAPMLFTGVSVLIIYYFRPKKSMSRLPWVKNLKHYAIFFIEKKAMRMRKIFFF